MTIDQDARATVADPPAPALLAARLRLVARTAWLVALVVPSLVLDFGWRRTGRASPWPQWFLGRAARACGVRGQPVGMPLTHDVLFVANHVSWVDILVIAGATGTRFVAQDKIRGWPLIGWLATLNATIFVSRTDRIGVAAQVAEVRAALGGTQPVTIFPEGTTTDGLSLLPFKPSLFAALEPPPRALMVQPVVLEFDAAGRSLAWIGTEGAGPNARRVLGRRGTFGVRVHFLAPFDPAAIGDRKAVAGEARRRIAAELARLHGVPVA